ncbi:MAG: hypothetical protein JXJ20_08020 [Anaerolineae bacterium]|nr:hypothetical protein [Anaerolineae bacterium]
MSANQQRHHRSRKYCRPTGQAPVNTLVMGAGSYSFGDYIKVGALMSAIMLIVTLIAVPLPWPF